ncbi:hypothetical protein K435DRAFT_787113 [Dendrothele bispora CBS 962.96]|uniref:Uncharacterized protein n=1 Tax=Dendrothele bispora (strain CBS 962.96) TaxID=1314807 RepID=A0A4V4HAS1_DENBC|nr:hypothetical protein K435DRAFT_787113 [Dendrothele bispora CBS 962.96]
MIDACMRSRDSSSSAFLFLILIPNSFVISTLVPRPLLGINSNDLSRPHSSASRRVSSSLVSIPITLQCPPSLMNYLS